MNALTDDTRPTATADPLDDLVPPPRRWWIRLLIAGAVIAAVAVASIGYGFGYVYPRPECCGSGSGDAPMSLTPDGEAVMVWSYFYNSSGRDLLVTGATADLPGARVVDVGFVDAAMPPQMPSDPDPFPGVVGGREMSRIAIAFVPERCDDSGGPWGSVTLDLEVTGSRWPSIGRSFTLPDPVVDPARGLSVFGPDSFDGPSYRDPLAAACALLDIDA